MQEKLTPAQESVVSHMRNQYVLKGSDILGAVVGRDHNRLMRGYGFIGVRAGTVNVLLRDGQIVQDSDMDLVTSLPNLHCYQVTYKLAKEQEN